ncbi:MAG TPA: hypothetical protein VGE65_00475 [Sphingobium sp.]
MGRPASVKWPLAIAALCSATLAPAQSAPPENGGAGDEEIVVTKGAPPTRKEVYDQALALSRASRKYDENLARFQVPVCPGVLGFKTEAANVIIERIRANAVRVGVKQAKGKCSPNLIVAIVDDGGTLLSNLERTRPQIFSLISASERAELLTDTRPVRVWSNIVTLRDDGIPIPRAADGKEMLPSVWGYTNRWFVKFHRDILAALVVFNREDILGMTYVQLADYATMRGLTHTRDASGNEPMPTILGLFARDDRDIPELTSFDVGYLRSLYWEAATESSVSKLLRIRRQAEKAQREAMEADPAAAEVARP